MAYKTTNTDPSISPGLFSALSKCSTPLEPIIENSVGCPHGTITWKGKERVKRRFVKNASSYYIWISSEKQTSAFQIYITIDFTKRCNIISRKRFFNLD